MKTAVVFYGRNDGYKEKERTLICINSMVDTFDEVWFVDWNSPEDKGPLLWDIEDGLKKEGKIRHVIIPPKIAQMLTPEDASVVNGIIPPNLVFRRTNADWIVATSLDIIPPFKHELHEFLENADPNTFYTLSRREVDYEEVLKNQDNLEEFRKNLPSQIPPRYFPAKVTPNDNYSLINCCGDFQLATKEVWNKVKGYEEAMYYACYPDTNVQKKAVLNGYNLEAIYDIPLYHMSHAGMGNDGSSPSKQKYNDPIKWVENFTESENDDDWGLANIEIEYETI